MHPRALRPSPFVRLFSNSGLLLVTLLFAIVLISTSGWAQLTNCPPEPVQNTAIVSGQTYYGSNCVLNTTGDVDSFQFTAAAGDTWSMIMGLGASHPTNICMDLYDPGRTDVFHGCTNWYYGGTYSVTNNQKLTAAGTYTIVITEVSDAVQPYGLSLERLNPAPPDAVPLFPSKNVASTIATPTTQNVFTFPGDTSGTYQIVASLNPASNNVCFNVYQPDGTVVVSAACTNWYYAGKYSVSEDVTPTQDGTYVVVVYVAGNDGSVGYNLEVTCLFGGCTDQLTVTKVGNGKVTSTDGNINCGATCSFTYFSGSAVTLNATADQGWMFAGWSGACSGTGSCDVTMTQNQSVQAMFTQPTYPLTVTTTGNGTVTSTDGFINCPGTCSHSYLYNTQVTLNAAPANGWIFSGWSGACSGTGSCNVTMTQAQSVGATFTQLDLLTVSTTGTGQVTSTDGFINCPGTCSHYYPSNTQVTLNAAPAQGWSFTAGAGRAVVPARAW